MRLLIVSYYFPPAAGGGVQRVLKFAKYLPEFGVEVHVLAPDDPQWVDSDAGLAVPEGTHVHRTRYLGPPPGKPKDILAGRRGLDRAWTRLKLQPRRVLVPDLHVGWTITAVPAGRRVVREHGVDVVLSTSPPETDHLVGRRISRAAGLPWVADLRDSWLNEPGLRLDRRTVRVKRRINTRLSNRTVGTADLVLTVSDPITDELRQQYPTLDVRTLMNGVDLDDFRDLPTLPAHDRFTITYTGNFFGRRSPRPFLAGLRQLLERRPDLADEVAVRFVGSLKPEDAELVSRDARLRGIVQAVSFVPYRETLAEQRRADLLLLAIASGPRHQGEVTGKLFEYLGARRPLLAVVPPEGAAARFLEGVDGATVADPDDPAAVAAGIERAHAQWTADGRTTRDLALTDELSRRISRRGRAEQLAEMLHELVPARKNRSPA